MNRGPNNQRNNKGPRTGGGVNQPEAIPNREGGDDSLADTSPTDSRADEVVIVNQQREHKTVNAPSQTAANTSEEVSSDEDVVNGS